MQMGFPLITQDKIITKEGDTHEVYNVEISDRYIFFAPPFFYSSATYFCLLHYVSEKNERESENT